MYQGYEQWHCLSQPPTLLGRFCGLVGVKDLYKNLAQPINEYEQKMACQSSRLNMSTSYAQGLIAIISLPSTMDLGSLLAPLHLLSFSTLMGTQLYHTFVVTKISYESLPRSAFTTLQKRLFPIYFGTQSLLLLLTAVTIPSRGPLTLITDKTAWIPFTIAGITAISNLLVFGPRTRQIMIQRIHQGECNGCRLGG